MPRHDVVVVFAKAQTAIGVALLGVVELGPEGERKLLDEGISVRCIQRSDGTVPASEDEPDLQAIVARAY